MLGGGSGMLGDRSGVLGGGSGVLGGTPAVLGGTPAVLGGTPDGHDISGAGAPDMSDISDMSLASANEAPRLTLVPVTLAKGLEFDHVVLVEPGRIATGEAHGLRRLYVALTRAVSRLTVFHAEPLPAELSLSMMVRP
jgi:hypothetical protein